MADPILGLDELLDGDQLGYARQNTRNLVMARLAVDPRIAANNLSAPPVSSLRGQAWILSGAGSGLWSGQTAGTIAVALSNTPSTAAGWFFLPPQPGMRVWVLAGSPTGHLVYNGTNWSAV